MERVIKILIERDGDTREEAISRIEETRSLMKSCGYDPEECERVFMEELGLEMDYIMDIIL